jgi:undecaprenyl-diphosphatase
MLSVLIHIDTELMLWLNSFHSSFWDVFMYIVSDKWTWLPMYAVIVYVLLRKYGFKLIFLWICLMFFFAILFSDQLCGGFIRSYFERYRPSNLSNPISHYVHIVDGYRGGRYGFPSCHAANSFALATLLFLLFRNRMLTITIFVWAVLNSYSRVYLGVHYPGDLLVGALIGTGGAIGMYYGFRYMFKIKHEVNYKHINFIAYVGMATVAIILIYSGIRVCCFA